MNKWPLNAFFSESLIGRVSKTSSVFHSVFPFLERVTLSGKDGYKYWDWLPIVIRFMPPLTLCDFYDRQKEYAR